MSLAQFPAFPRPTPAALTRSSPPISSPSQQMPPVSSASTPHPLPHPRGGGACCENGRPILTDPHTGQTVCSCQYPPPGGGGGGVLPSSVSAATAAAAAALSAYPRTPMGAGGVGGAGLPPGLESVYNASAYAAAGYVALGAEGSAFYSPLGSGPFDLKESAEAWRTLAASQPGFPYDPMAVYPYGPGKNATRENTNTLKAWLYEHRKNPYPTKGEKIMLAIITKMTLTQVSTWFANARRRLKKENKMTWSPRNRSEDGSDDIDNPDDDDDCADARNRSVVMSPSDQHELDITSSKPASPILSSDSSHIGLNNNRPFKERIIRVDEDDDDEDDDDCNNDNDDLHHDHHNNDIINDDVDDDNAIARLNRFRFRHLEELQRRGGDNNNKTTPLLSSSRDLDRERDHDRDRSPLRSFSDSDATDDVLLTRRVRGITSTGTSELERPPRRASSVTRENSETDGGRPNSPSKSPSCSSPSSSPSSSHPAPPPPPLRTNTPSDKSCPSSPTQSRPQQSSSSASLLLSPSSSSSSTSTSSLQQKAPPTTRPKIWSISDVISTTSSSSSSNSSTSVNSSSNSSSTSNPLLPSSLILSPSSSSSLSTPSPSTNLVPSLSSLPSPLSLNRHHPFLPHPHHHPHHPHHPHHHPSSPSSSSSSSSSPSSSSAPRPIPNPGFLFLPHAPAHWQAAAARFAGMGGAYPLSLAAHSTLSYPYNLATPNAVRAGLEAHAQSVAQFARATAEGNAAAASIAAAAAVAASRGGGMMDSSMREGGEGKISLVGMGLPRHPNGSLLPPGRDVDAVRSHGMGPPRMVVDTSLQ